MRLAKKILISVENSKDKSSLKVDLEFVPTYGVLMVLVSQVRTK